VRTALIVGQSGGIGHGLAEHLATRDDWSIVTLGRQPSVGLDAPHICLDLTNRDCLGRNFPLLGQVTHIFNCARAPAANSEDERRRNLDLLTNLVDLAERSSPKLQHVALVHGTKWYGCHRGPYPTPALESDPPCDDPSFYAVQQNFIERRQSGADWAWSALRPHTIWGLPARSGNSIVILIAVYALLLKSQGEPLHFPGPEKTFRKLSQATDAQLLNRALEWVATTPSASNDAFNITNGDFFRWERIWPAVADFFGMRCGGVQTISLAETMPPVEPHWADIARHNKLTVHDLRSVVNWSYGDLIFSLAWTDMSSTIKARNRGFPDAIDSRDALLNTLGDLRRRKYIP
jgi:nucleoside-diphosphate-sugar epimerase